MSSRLEHVYAASPVLLQNAACSLIGAQNRFRRFGHDFHRRIAACEQRLTWGEGELLTYRDRRLVGHGRLAVETVPHYRDLARSDGFTAADLRSVDDIRAHFPVLMKSEVQSLGERLRSEAAKPRRCAIVKTSGTTGAGVRILVPYASTREQWAVWWRYWHIHGITQKTRGAWFAGRTVVPPSVTQPPFWRYNLVGRQVLYSGYHLGPKYLDAYVMHLRQSGVRWLHGYPSNVALLASHMLDRGYSLEGQVSVVTLAAENLTDHQRSTIAAAFGVTPFQHYGNAEAVANASECPHGTFHVDEDFAYVEAVKRTAEGVSALVGTNFTNPAFPLIRYDMGDIGTLTEQSCPCGRAGRALASVDGRLEDAIVLPSGARVGRLDHIFKDMGRIREAQIYQPDVSAIVLRVARGDGYTAVDEHKLLSEARQRLGHEPKISIEYVERLPRTRTGKLRMVLSDVATGPAALVPDHEGGC